MVKVSAGLRDEMLKILRCYYYLTSAQITRVHYAEKSLSHVQEIVKRLYEERYLERAALPVFGKGTGAFVYSLNEPGIKRLRELGYEVPGRFAAQGDLRHTVAVNDFLIGLELGARQYRYEITEMIHERDFKRDHDWVENRRGEKLSIIPDGWVDLRNRNGLRECLAIEVDRGTERKPQWREKVEAYLAWERKGYQKRFGTDRLTVVTVTVEQGEDKGARARQVLSYIEDALMSFGAQERRGMFLVAPLAFDLNQLVNERFYAMPFHPRLVALLGDWINAKE